MEQYDATGGGKFAGVSTPLKAPTLTPAQQGAIASYAGPTPNTSISSFSAGPAPYIAPVQNYAGPQSNPYNTGPLLPQQQAPTQQSFAPAPPPPPPVPPTGGRQWYNGLDQGAKASYDQSQLATDSDYTAQMGEYDKALKTFIDRIASQKKMFNQDAEDATASTNRNQGLTLDQLGEDFGARGLAYSGLAVDSADKTNSRFNEAKGQIGKVLAKNNSDADMRQADYQTENDISKQNALRSATSRQAQRQALIDSMAGF